MHVSNFLSSSNISPQRHWKTKLPLLPKNFAVYSGLVFLFVSVLQYHVTSLSFMKVLQLKVTGCSEVQIRKSFIEKGGLLSNFAVEGSKKRHTETEVILILVIAQTILILSQVQSLVAGLKPLQRNTMKINMLTLLGLFSINCNICMTFNCGHARKLRALEVRSIKNSCICYHAGGQARFRKATVLGMYLLNIYP